MKYFTQANKVPEHMEWRRVFKERRQIESNWRKPNQARAGSLKGHRSTVFCLFLMGDNRLVTAGDDASIRIWDLQTKSCEYVAESAHTHGILGMYYDPLTNKILSGCYNGTVKMWDVNIERRNRVAQMTARELKDIMDKKKVYYGDCIEKADLVSRVLTSHAMPVFEQKYELKEHNANIVGAHMMNGLGATSGHDHCSSLQFRPSFDSDPFSSFSSWDCLVINVFQVDTGKQLVKLAGHDAPSSAVQFYDSAQRLVSGGHDFTIHVWNLERKTPEFSMRNAHNGWVWHVLYNETSKTLVSGSVDGTVRVWDTSSGKLSHVLPHAREVSGLWVDWNRHLVLSASFSGEMRTHDLRTGAELAKYRVSGDRCTRVTCSYDQAYVGSFDGAVGVFDYTHNI